MSPTNNEARNRRRKQSEVLRSSLSIAKEHPTQLAGRHCVGLGVSSHATVVSQEGAVGRSVESGAASVRAVSQAAATPQWADVGRHLGEQGPNLDSASMCSTTQYSNGGETSTSTQ